MEGINIRLTFHNMNLNSCFEDHPNPCFGSIPQTSRRFLYLSYTSTTCFRSLRAFHHPHKYSLEEDWFFEIFCLQNCLKSVLKFSFIDFNIIKST